MGYKQERHIVRFGAVSTGIVLPKGWTDFNNLKNGDHVTVLGNSVLVVSLPKDELKARRVLELIEELTYQKVVAIEEEQFEQSD